MPTTPFATYDRQYCLIFLAQTNFSLLLTTLINLRWLSKFIVLYSNFSQKLSVWSAWGLELMACMSWSPKKSLSDGLFCRNFLAFFNLSSRSWRVALRVEGYLLAKVSGLVGGGLLMLLRAKESRGLRFATSLDRKVLGDSYVMPNDLRVVSSGMEGMDCRKHSQLAQTALFRLCFFIRSDIRQIIVFIMDPPKQYKQCLPQHQLPVFSWMVPFQVVISCLMKEYSKIMEHWMQYYDEYLLKSKQITIRPYKPLKSNGALWVQ